MFQPFKRSFFLLVVLCFFVIGILLGYELHQEGVAHGCFPLQEDLLVVPNNPKDEGTIRFGVIGDTGTANQDQQQVADSLARICRRDGCDLVLMLGDNFYPGGLRNLADPLFRKAFLEVYQELDVPIYPVLGNHDVKGNVQAQLYQSQFHRSWNMPNYNYTFDAGPARFHGINSNCHLNTWYQLHRVLEDSAEHELEHHWTVVFGHHPIYSNGAHGDTDFVQQLLWNWLIEDQVDFYLAGHDHHLNALTHNDTRTRYLISGAGGANYREQKNPEDFPSSKAKSHFVHRDNGFLWMEINRESAKFRFYGKAGELLYENRIDQKD